MAKELNINFKFVTKPQRGSRRKLNLYEDYNEGEIIMTKERNSVVLPRNEKPYEYRMSQILAKELLKNRRGEEKKMKPNDYLCKIVNEQFGIAGKCVYVHQD